MKLKLGVAHMRIEVSRKSRGLDGRAFAAALEQGRDVLFENVV